MPHPDAYNGSFSRFESSRSMASLCPGSHAERIPQSVEWMIYGKEKDLQKFSVLHNPFITHGLAEHPGSSDEGD